MNRNFLSTLIIAGMMPAGFLHAADPEPGVKSLQPGVQLSLVAEHPELATPTGIDVDDQGRVFLVACHTHMPGEDYPGPDRDEILIFDPDGKRTVFYNRTYHTMDLELGPDGWVYLAERDRIFRIRDTDDDGVADTEEDLAVLTTEADYPHNGLSGLAWHPDGDLVFGLGENFAKGWTIRDTEGTEISGIGEGAVFRCHADGGGLHRIARGMWNPFGVCVRTDGEIFVSDNDPGERPPCRLLHIVEGGDYGYQRQYGGEAHHPFVGWNGELRGTLPMVHPTGEAPCGVVQFDSGLLIPSWSDHRIDFFPLRREGSTFAAERIALVQGGRYFRPTCIAEDGSQKKEGRRTWFLTDWVDGRYQVHGYGRLWRLEIDLKEAGAWKGPSGLEPPNEDAKLAARLRSGSGEEEESELLRLIEDEDPFIARAALIRLSDGIGKKGAEANFSSRSESERISMVLAWKVAGVEPGGRIPLLLKDESPGVVFETLRWIADAQLDEFLPSVSSLLERSDLTFEVFEAAMAAWNTLSGTPEMGVRNPEKLLARVQDENSSPRLRAFALRLLPTPANTAAKSDPAARIRYPKGLTVALLEELLEVGDAQLSLEVVRVLAGSPRLGTPVLLRLARDEKRDASLRAEAISGLGASAGEIVGDLIALAESEERVIREEALRSLRTLSLDGEKKAAIENLSSRYPDSADLIKPLLDPSALAVGRPSPEDVDAWLVRLKQLPGEADPAAGQRVFHHASLALCANCHRHDGRGKIVGPDLGAVSGRGDHRWLLESILQPGLEIAPEYLPRMVTLHDGTTATGIRLRSWVREQLRDANGHTLSFDRDEVASIEELTTSFMPPGLVYTMTDREIRDLLAFLEKGSSTH
jgi:putative membrane-bound dehydrogenase-like protein